MSLLRNLSRPLARPGSIAASRSRYCNVDGYNEIRYISRMLRRRANPHERLPLPRAMFHPRRRCRSGPPRLRHHARRRRTNERRAEAEPGHAVWVHQTHARRGLIVELSDRQRPDEDDERRRYYRLTAFGRAVAQAEATQLATLLRQARRRTGARPRIVRQRTSWPKARLASASIECCCGSTRATSRTTTLTK